MLTQHVYRVASRILAASNLGTVREIDASAGRDGDVADSEPGWTLIVINAPKIINAMAGPRELLAFLIAVLLKSRKPVHKIKMAGTIVVFTGMLRLCKDENGLAAVLSHGWSPE